MAISQVKFSMLLMATYSLTAQVQPSLAKSVQPATVSAEGAKDMLGRFIVPSRALLAATLGVCDHSYRMHLSRINGWDRTEAALPGITDAMVKVAVDRCRISFSNLYDGEADWARVRASEIMTPTEMIKLYPLIAPAVAETEAMQINFGTGESSTQAVDQAASTSQAILARFNARVTAFARRPGNSQLTTKLMNFQIESKSRMNGVQQLSTSIGRIAIQEGDAAGNDFAKAHGKSPIF